MAMENIPTYPLIIPILKRQEFTPETTVAVIELLYHIQMVIQYKHGWLASSRNISTIGNILHQMHYLATGPN